MYFVETSKWNCGYLKQQQPLLKKVTTETGANQQKGHTLTTYVYENADMTYTYHESVLEKKSN